MWPLLVDTVAHARVWAWLHPAIAPVSCLLAGISIHRVRVKARANRNAVVLQPGAPLYTPAAAVGGHRFVVGDVVVLFNGRDAHIDAVRSLMALPSPQCVEHVCADGRSWMHRHLDRFSHERLG